MACAGEQFDGRFASAIEAIYDSAPQPELWPHALSAIANVFEAKGTVLLFNRDDGSMTAIVSPGLEDAVADYDRGWWRHDIRVQRGLERALINQTSVYTDRHIASPEELRTHPFYVEFLAKHGLGHFIGGSVSPHPKVFAGLSVQGPLGGPPYTDDDLTLLARIGRHVEKALRLSIRLMEAEVTNVAVGDALSRLGSGVVIVDERGHAAFCNDAASALIGDGLTLLNGRIGAEHREDAVALSSAIHAVSCWTSEALFGDPRPIFIRRQRKRPLIAYVLPIRQPEQHRHSSLLLAARALVLLLNQDSGAPPDPALVRDILHLTLGEARVASLVGAGKTPREAAETLGITEETTRTVLKRIYAKTGISRQSELAAMLARLTLV